MKHSFLRLLMSMWLALTLTGNSFAMSDASPAAETREDALQRVMAQVDYVNASRSGAQLVVIPGDITTSNGFFSQVISSQFVADVAERELARANFKVIERGDLGPLLDDFRLAFLAEDEKGVRPILQRGKLNATRWVVRFDIPAVAVQEAGGAPVNPKLVFGLLTVMTGGLAAGAMLTPANSMDKLMPLNWRVGLRYTVYDAGRAREVASEVVEESIKAPQPSTDLLRTQAVAALEALVQHLVQKAVARIDRNHK